MSRPIVQVGCNHQQSRWDVKVNGVVVESHRTQTESTSRAIELAKSLSATYQVYDKSGKLIEEGGFKEPIMEIIEPETVVEVQQPTQEVPVTLTEEPTPVSKMGVVDQVRLASKPGNRLATFLGALLGGFVPIATYVVAHQELNLSENLFSQPKFLLVLGGLFYSAKTVYQWGKLAFAGITRALGFTVLLEGVMIFSSVQWLSYTALAYLILINAIGTGVSLALGQGKED